MKKQMIRVISLALFAALVLGLFGGVPALTTTAASAEADANVGVLKNPGFEEIDSETGLPKYWSALGETNWSVVDSSVADCVFEGKKAVKMFWPETETGYSTGIVSDYIPIKGDNVYEISVMGKDIVTTSRSFQVGVFYHDADKKQLMSKYTTGPVTGEWNYIDMHMTAPADAAYARVYIVCGAARGEAYIDKVTFAEANQYHNTTPTMYDGKWELNYNEYPRLYFSKDGLAKIKEFTKSEEICAYGYSGAATLKELVEKADKYLEYNTMDINHNGKTLTYELSPVLKDPTARPEYEVAPPNYSSAYPYLTATTTELLDRTRLFAMAYAVTGDVKYGERAKQYALDMCDWEYWVGYYMTVVVGGHAEHSEQSTGYIVDAVMVVYDMCNDLLSAQDKAKMEKALIEKGLEAEYHDCWPRMNRMRDMDHATGLILAALTIANENNIDQLKKYLDMGVTYINWRLDHFMYSGINEGEMYDSLAVDDIIVTLDMLERMTGLTGFMDHPYVDQLEERIAYGFEHVKGTMPAYSDSEPKSYFPTSAAVFAQRGNKMIANYIVKSGLLDSAMDKLIYHTDKTLEEFEMPSDREGNVGYVSAHGFGTLRTGWGAMDTVLVVRANASEESHNHYESNSIQLAFNGNWLLTDTAYQDLTYGDFTTWQIKYTNSTIFVDGKPQVNKGHASLEQVFDSHLYGYLIGDAAEAYGMEDKQAVLNKFDRHMIMLNHDENPYYVIIDDLDSNKDRNFGWNFYTNGWDRLEIDGVNVEKGSSGSGNHVAIAKTGAILHSYFVGKSEVTSKEVTYKDYGPTLLIESEKAKNHQFMNVLSVEQSAGGQWTTVFQHLRPEGETRTTITERIEEGQISWVSTRENETSTTTLNVAIGAPMIMFRAGNPGDWISFPIKAEESCEYTVTLTGGKTTGYKGLWDLYIDDTLIYKDWNPNKESGGNELVAIELGKITLEQGNHTFKAVLASTPNTAYQGTFFGLGSLVLDNGKGLGEGKIKVVESYDEGDLLGATINYGTALNDIVLFNRGTGSIAGGKLATNGQQASVLGASETAVNEGYAVTNGTSLKYGDQVLVNANGAVSLAVDFTLAKDGKAEEGFDAAKPVIYISSKADAARTASVYIGIDAGYTATVDGEAVAVTYANGMLTLNVPEGEHEIVVTGDTTVAPGPAPAPEGGEDQPDPTGDSTAIVGMIAVMILAATTMVTLVVSSKKRAF